MRVVCTQLAVLIKLGALTRVELNLTSPGPLTRLELLMLPGHHMRLGLQTRMEDLTRRVVLMPPEILSMRLLLTL